MPIYTETSMTQHLNVVKVLLTNFYIQSIQFDLRELRHAAFELGLAYKAMAYDGVMVVVRYILTWY